MPGKSSGLDGFGGMVGIRKLTTTRTSVDTRATVVSHPPFRSSGCHSFDYAVESSLYRPRRTVHYCSTSQYAVSRRLVCLTPSLHSCHLIRAKVAPPSFLARPSHKPPAVSTLPFTSLHFTSPHLTSSRWGLRTYPGRPSRRHLPESRSPPRSCTGSSGCA